MTSYIQQFGQDEWILHYSISSYWYSGILLFEIASCSKSHLSNIHVHCSVLPGPADWRKKLSMKPTRSSCGVLALNMVWLFESFKRPWAKSFRHTLVLVSFNGYRYPCCVYIIYAFLSADRLLFVINTIKEEIVNRVQDSSNNNGTSMAEKLDKLIEETLGKKLFLK